MAWGKPGHNLLPHLGLQAQRHREHYEATPSPELTANGQTLVGITLKESKGTLDEVSTILGHVKPPRKIHVAGL